MTVLERDILKAIRDYLKIQNIPHYRMTTGTFTRQNRYVVTQPKGMPDIIGYFDGKHHPEARGRIIAIEVKRPGKKPTKDQEEFLQAVNKAGGLGFHADSVDKVAVEIANFKQRIKDGKAKKVRVFPVYAVDKHRIRN